MTITKNHIWIVIPCYNESKSLSQLLKKVKTVTQNIVVIDDGSSDTTGQIAKKWTKHVLRHRVNLGKGAALKTGCEYVFGIKNGQAVIFMDGDGQHNPTNLALFYQELKQGSNCVFGVRDLNHKMPILRRLGNKFLSILVWMLFGVYFHDILSGYRAITKDTYSKIFWLSDSYQVEAEVAIQIAKKQILFDQIHVDTIYFQLDRGMTALDTVHIVIEICKQRFTF